ncbi:MAG: hypothetical protein KAH07_05615 [Flavobacteriaceae bacterium]|nr:hypothetical protein [Flavobacteriaceae bacterium]
MKKTILKQPLIYLSLLLVMAISFNSCSDDDDDDKTPAPATKMFLETYAGTVWTDEDGNFFRFGSTISILAESWERNTYYPYILAKEAADKAVIRPKPMVCYEYDTFEEADVELVSTSENELVVKITKEGDVETLTFTKNEDGTITILVEMDGEDDMTMTLTSSEEDVDELTVCVDGYDAPSFLRNNAGTVWTDKSGYFKFSTDISILVEAWKGSATMKCYDYGTLGSDDAEIIESTANKLVVKLPVKFGERFPTTLTFIKNIGSITFLTINGRSEITKTLLPSDTNVDALTKCMMLVK